MAKDVGQRELNQGGFVISNLGAPVALTDAARLQDVQASNGATLSDNEAHSVDGATQELICEWLVNFDDISSGAATPQIRVRLAGIGLITDTGVNPTGTYNVRVGSSAPGVLDGTIRATYTTPVHIAPYPEEFVTNQGAAFNNPTGYALVQVTAAHSDVAGTAQLRGIEISIR